MADLILSTGMLNTCLAEVLLLDAYRANPLKNGGAVVDLRADIGDFFFLASKRVGPDGKVVAHEPNAEDYEMLETKIEKNGCENVIALIIGVAEEPGKNRSLFGTGSTGLWQTRWKTYWCICKKFIASMLAKPHVVLEILLLAAGAYPKIIYLRISGTLHNDCRVTGVYVKPVVRAAIIQ